MRSSMPRVRMQAFDAFRCLVALSALPGFFVLVFNLATRTRLKARETGPHDVLSKLEHCRLLFISVVQVIDCKKMPSLLREGCQRRHGDCQAQTSTGFLAILKGINLFVRNLYRCHLLAGPVLEDKYLLI